MEMTIGEWIALSGFLTTLIVLGFRVAVSVGKLVRSQEVLAEKICTPPDIVSTHTEECDATLEDHGTRIGNLEGSNTGSHEKLDAILDHLKK